jgi:hypothetical protein
MDSALASERDATSCALFDGQIEKASCDGQILDRHAL